MIGAGGFGSVYVTLDRTTGKQLACKIVNLRRLREKHLQDCHVSASTSAATYDDGRLSLTDTCTR